MYHSYKNLAAIIMAGSMISACGGSDGDTDTAEFNQTVSPDEYHTLQKTSIEPTQLKYASESELLNHLKNGIRVNVSVSDIDITPLRLGDGINTPIVLEAAIEDASADASGIDFSTTNTHVAGVDESDFIKYDGNYLYMSIYGYNSITDSSITSGPGIRILETTPNSAQIEEIATIPVDDAYWGNINTLYLTDSTDSTSSDTLITLRNHASYGRPSFTEGLMAADIYMPAEEKIEIVGYDVQDPSNPEQRYSIEIDGYINNSRKIGNTLYLVSNYFPYLPTIQYYFSSEEDAQENEESISELTLDDLLPTVSINGAEATTLMQPDTCLVPANLEDRHGYAAITSVIAIDLDLGEISSVNCLNAQVNGLYANQDSLYLGGSMYKPWENAGQSFSSYTVVHKFNLGEQIRYRSTGTVPGWLGWRDPSFRMDEFDNQLRIVTTENNITGNPEHRLSILEDSNTTDEMRLVAELPNDESPAPIGKPGEDIFSVRFVGEQAYIVTFMRTDPLYVLDLSDATNPQIAGELEVPGFSTYLHPVGENYLLGIGQDADENGFARGVKASLFDVRDMSSPQLIGSETFGSRGSWSPALNDLRAITFLQTNADQLRFAFPISIYGEGFIYWQEDALHLFEINGLSSANDGASESSADLSFVGKITSESADDERTWPNYSGIDRSVLHNDAIYYAHGDFIWAGFWTNPETATGPH
ncbi:MAG: beta-propeller domain-containing protein [Agarilytica sp.]